MQLVTVRDVIDCIFTLDSTANTVMIDSLGASSSEPPLAILGFSHQDMSLIKVSAQPVACATVLPSICRLSDLVVLCCVVLLCRSFSMAAVPARLMHTPLTLCS